MRRNIRLLTHVGLILMFFVLGAVAADASNAKKDDITKRAIRIGVMLPLHDVDGDGRRMTEYYRGLLMACDELRQQGISTDIHAWNVPIDADIRTTLLQNGATDCDIIFGPLYTKQVAELAKFCKAYSVKLVIPFSISATDVRSNPMVYQVYRSQAAIDDSAVQAFVNLFANDHPVFIDCNSSDDGKGAFTRALRMALDKKGINFNLTNISTPDEAFAKAFPRDKRNIVVLNTARSPQLNQVLQRFDALKKTYPQLQISLFGYNEWMMYRKYDEAKFFEYDTYIPSLYYLNMSSAKTQQLMRSYRQWFREDMMEALPRFALTGYDHAMFFLKGLHAYGTKFTGSRWMQPSQPVQTPLKFVHLDGGGYQNVTFQLIHFTRSQSVEAISY